MVEIKTLHPSSQKIVEKIKTIFAVDGQGVSSVQMAELLGMALVQYFPGKQKRDKLGNALARGLSVREEMANDEGGSVSSSEAGHRLGISKQAAINQYHAGKLLAWKSEKQGALLFPVWQFADGGRLPGLPEVLEKLHASQMLDEWGKIGFFLQTSARLGQRRPLDLLRDNQKDLVMQAAAAYVE